MAKTGRGRTLVIGGSMSGLFAGLMLRQAGFDVTIHERVGGELSGRGAGIVAQPMMIAALRSLGVDPVALGVEAQRRRCFDAGGRLILQTECPQVLTAWERLYRMLRDAFPAADYHRGSALTRVTQDAGGVTAHFADGLTATADLLVAGDGIRSTVRAQLLPQAAPRYAGYVAWRALIDEAAIPADVHAALFEFMSFGLPPGEQFLSYPVAGPDNDLRPGHRRSNVIWYRPADEATALRDLLTDAQGVHHPLSIPPALIRREHVTALQDAARRLAPQMQALVALMPEPLLQPIYDLESPAMALGRVALIGDAAFVARPHVGAGVSKAAGDAAALAAAVARDGIVPGLRRFEAERLPAGRRIIQQARHLGAYLQASQSEADRAHSRRHGTAQAVLAETALVDFLDDAA